MQCWRHLGLHPSEPTRSFSLRSWPAYSRVLLLALCGAFEGSSSSLPPTQPLKEGPSGIGSRNKRALVRHRWALAVGAIGTFHGRNKGKKGFVVCSLVLPRSRCRESRDTCLGAAHLEWNQGRSSAADSTGMCRPSLRGRAFCDYFFISYTPTPRMIKRPPQVLGLGKRGPIASLGNRT